MQCKIWFGGVFSGSFTPLQFIPKCWCVYHREVHMAVPALKELLSEFFEALE